jgi:dTDP-4-dehydrorhamnose reductase|tara:strand:+ start:1940 stop:2824 length:885 start_codon:yes stop_codon:yes gene_type:complete
MSKILVTGKNGQLGKSIQKLIKNTEQTNKFIFVGREELDLSNESMITRYFKDNSFDIIINCAAYTQVDKAEEEQKLANQVNNLAVSQLAQIAKNQQAKLIHISTDYVFDGKNNKPYKETDRTNPISVYGKTKLAGEKAIQEILPTNATIIRVSWMYSEYGNNFVKTMLRIGKERDEINVINDQIGSPTYATDLAKVILQAIKYKNLKKENQITQIYHYSNEGKISWYEFAKEIFKIAKVDCKVNPIVSEDYPALAKRPKIVLMNKSKISLRFDIKSKELRESLECCMIILKEQQ